MYKPQDETPIQAPSTPPEQAPVSQPSIHQTLWSLLGEVRQLRRDRVLAPGADQQKSSQWASPTSEQLLQAVFALERNIQTDATEEDVVRLYLETFKALYPSRQFAARLCGRYQESLSLIYATHEMSASEKDVIRVSEPALQAQHFFRAESLPACVTVVPEYQPVFSSDGHGFDIALVQDDQFLGALSVEYPGRAVIATDRNHLAQMALHLASTLRKSRMLRDSLYIRNYLAKLLEHANAPIVVIGKNREIRFANRAFVGLTGFSREQLIDQEFSQLFPESEQTRLLPVFINALRGVPTTNFELKLLQKSQGYARLAMNIASVLNPLGEVEGVICIGRDLTELRQLEEQIVQAEKLATLGQLAAGVVHELNNPLTSISVYSEYLLKKALTSEHDPKDVEKLRRITDSAERMLRFTRDLVTYARPSTAKPMSVSIHDVLDQATVFCEHVISTHGVQIERQYTQESALIFAVPSQLHQVFINLITNACHAMGEDNGKLLLITDITAGGDLRVRLQDNGPGIPPQLADRVFEPFFTTKGEGKGTGLGLSIARNIIEQHNGRISIAAASEGGAVFEIVLPRRQQTPETL